MTVPVLHPLWFLVRASAGPGCWSHCVINAHRSQQNGLGGTGRDAFRTWAGRALPRGMWQGPPGAIGGEAPPT